MLDTNIVSYLLRGRHAVLESRLRQIEPGAVCISVITRAELRYGVARVPEAPRLAREVDRFLQGIVVLSWSDGAADAYGQIRAWLEQRGMGIGALDTMIAAHALASDITLVTNDESVFRRVPGLRVENWMLPPSG
ncbi:MAG: type II toxin-antitoxin system VapC family toxin [Lautropia sp.]|nr:type II toxin-antitoxin system VapC family toxin [Lautropia sp.]